MSSEDLKLRAIQIRDEVMEGRNTATRVGQLLLDIIEQSSTLEIIESNQLGTIFATDYNLYSALSTDCRITEELEGFLDKIDDRYLRKDKDDTGTGFYTWEAGWMTKAPVRSAEYNIGWEVEIPTGWYVSETGIAWYTSLNVRGAVLSSGIIGSPYYVSGWTGYGSQWDMVSHRLETDYISVRKELKVYALDVFRIYGTNGDLAVSTTNKIDRVEDMGSVWRCYINDYDGEMYMNMRIDDVVKCQTWEKLSGRYYMAVVTNIDEKWFELSKTLLEGTTTPAPGDVVIRWDNLTDKNRKGLLYLSASDSYAPYMDVRYGDWNATAGTIKVRNGRLDGINDPLYPELYGAVNNFGLYTSNFYGTGELILRSTGESVSRTFEILKDSMTMGFNELREEVYVSPDNVLQNSTFLTGTTDYWEYTNVAYPLTFGGNIMLANGSLFSDLVSGAQIVKDSLNSRTVLQVTNTVVRQRNVNFNSRSAGKYAISFSFRPIVPYGSMTVGIEGSTMMVTVPLSDTSKWQRAEVTGDWDGTKDFVIQVTGAGIVNIVDISFADDRITNAITNLKVEYETKLTLKADQAQMNSFRDVYDEFERVVRRDYATQIWTATKINTEVGTIVDGRLTNYSTVSQTSTAINAAVRDLNIGQYATTTWVSNQITNKVQDLNLKQYATTIWTTNQINNKVADLNLGQYATTTWTTNQITNKVEDLNLGQYATTTWTKLFIVASVKDKVDGKEVESIVKQTYDSVLVAFYEELTDTQVITSAFYRFSMDNMMMNRRIEVGSGNNADNFSCQAGISPNLNNIAFWAGGTYNQSISGTVGSVLRHDGSGYLAKKNISWDTAGKTTFQSAANGYRVVIGADGRFRMYNNTVELLNFGYFTESDTYYYPSMKMYRKNSSGTESSSMSLDPTGLLFSSTSGSGAFFGVAYVKLDINRCPTPSNIGDYPVGTIYRDGVNLKIKTS